MDANSSGSANRSTTIAIANLDHRVSITKKIGTAIDPWTRDQLWVVCQSHSVVSKTLSELGCRRIRETLGCVMLPKVLTYIDYILP